MSPAGEGPAELRAALINTLPNHAEVYSALLWSLTRAQVDTDVFIDLRATDGIEKVIAPWWGSSMLPTTAQIAWATTN